MPPLGYAHGPGPPLKRELHEGGRRACSECGHVLSMDLTSEPGLGFRLGSLDLGVHLGFRWALACSLCCQTCVATQCHRLSFLSIKMGWGVASPISFERAGSGSQAFSEAPTLP